MEIVSIGAGGRYRTSVVDESVSEDALGAGLGSDVEAETGQIA